MFKRCHLTYFFSTDAPLAPEGPLEVSDVHKDGCKLKWKKPKDDGGIPLQGYEVEKMDPDTGTWLPVGKTKEPGNPFKAHLQQSGPKEQYEFVGSPNLQIKIKTCKTIAVVAQVENALELKLEQYSMYICIDQYKMCCFRMLKNVLYQIRQFPLSKELIDFYLQIMNAQINFRRIKISDENASAF